MRANLIKLLNNFKIQIQIFLMVKGGKYNKAINNVQYFNYSVSYIIRCQILQWYKYIKS